MIFQKNLCKVYSIGARQNNLVGKNVVEKPKVVKSSVNVPSLGSNEFSFIMLVTFVKFHPLKVICNEERHFLVSNVFSPEYPNIPFYIIVLFLLCLVEK